MIIAMRELITKMRVVIIKITGGNQTSDVRKTGESIDPPSDLDWAEIENYGADSEVVDFSSKSRRNVRLWRNQRPGRNRSFRSFRKRESYRETKGEAKSTLKQFRGKMQGAKSRIGFQKMETNFGKSGGENKIRRNDKPV